MVRLIHRDLLQSLLLPSPKGKLYVLEVTAGETYGRAHLPRAIQLVWNEVEDWLENEKPDRDVPVICYDEGPSGQHALEVAHLLDTLGFKEVAVYPEGKDDWESANLPTESDFYVEGREQRAEDVPFPMQRPLDEAKRRKAG